MKTVNNNMKAALILTLLLTAACGRPVGGMNPWADDASSPAPVPVLPAPVITAPAVPSYDSFSSTLILEGECEEGDIIDVSGNITVADLNPPRNVLQAPCSGGTFHLELEVLNSGTYNLSVKQYDAEGNGSLDSVVTWQYTNI